MAATGEGRGAARSSSRAGRASSREPLGVVLIIGPWNYPVQLVLAPLVGALAAGNAAVLKPSEVSRARVGSRSRSSSRSTSTPTRSRWSRAACPRPPRCSTERWDHIFYTGNGTVGRVVMAAAAKHLTPVTLELGGKSPAIVDRSANLDVAARRIAWGKYINAGQTCVAPDYVLVDRRVEGPLAARCRDAVRDFYGDDPQASRDYGAHRQRPALRAASRALLDDDGAGEVVSAASATRPTATSRRPCSRGVDPTSPIMQEEIFGPDPARCIAVDDVDAAIDVRQRPRQAAGAVRVRRGRRAWPTRRARARPPAASCVNATRVPPRGARPAVRRRRRRAAWARTTASATFETFSHRKSVLQAHDAARPVRRVPAVLRLEAAAAPQIALRRGLDSPLGGGSKLVPWMLSSPSVSSRVSTHLSVKTLRYYHDVGLLEPADVDPRSGYRMYATAQVPRAQLIRRFRDLDMPIDEVRVVLDAPDVAERDRAILGHLERMERELGRTQATVASLRALLEHSQPPLSVEYRSIGWMPALAVWEGVGWDDAEPWLDAVFADIAAVLSAHGTEPVGPAGALYADEFFEVRIGDVVAFVPIAGDAAAARAADGTGAAIRRARGRPCDRDALGARSASSTVHTARSGATSPSTRASSRARSGSTTS